MLNLFYARIGINAANADTGISMALNGYILLNVTDIDMG